MTQKQIAWEELNYWATGYYQALKTGVKLDKFKSKTKKAINALLHLGVPQGVIEDHMSDIALSIL